MLPQVVPPLTFTQYMFFFLKIREERWRGGGYFSSDLLSVFFEKKQFSLPAQYSYQSIWRGKRIYICPALLPCMLIFFNDVWYLSSGLAPSIPSPSTGSCSDCRNHSFSVWHPTAWLHFSSYPFLFSHLFIFEFFLSPRVKGYKV